jgi:hypothetical protein
MPITNKVEPYYCRICGKPIARPETRPGSAKGLLANHLKYKHPEEWERRANEEGAQIRAGRILR